MHKAVSAEFSSFSQQDLFSRDDFVIGFIDTVQSSPSIVVTSAAFIQTVLSE